MTVRKLLGLIGFVALCVLLIRVIETEPIQDFLGNTESALPDAAQTALADPGSNGTRVAFDPLRAIVVLPEDGRNAILGEFANAQTSIDLYVYLLPSDDAIEALHDAHERGVRVRVILEQDPFGGGNSNQEAYDRLQVAGIDVRWADDRFRFSHIKAFVIDESVAGIMTLNLSWTALTANREFAVITTEPADVQVVSDLFQADWDGADFEPQGSIVTSPDNSRAIVMDLLDRAGTRIDIYAEVLRDRDVRSALMAAAERGVQVRILIPADPADDDLLIYRELLANGVEIRYLTDTYSHAKAIIIDGSLALVGSQNLTQTSLEDNREAGILLDDRDNVDRLLSVFEADWEVSEPAGQ